MHDICILVPNYNNDKYLFQCLRSIFAQKTRASFFVYFCDDCSTDNSINIFKEFVTGYPSLCELKQNTENCGTLFTSLQLYKKIQAKYFTVLDGDDYWKNTNFLEEAYNFLETNSSYTVYAQNTILLDAQTGEETTYKPEVVVSKGFNQTNNKFDLCVPHTSSTVYRSNFDAKLLEDLKNISRNKMSTLVDAIYDHVFEGELFRNAYFAIKGKMFLDYQKVAGVYRINLPNSRWSSLPEALKHCINAVGFLSMANLTQKKEIKKIFYDLSQTYVSFAASLNQNIYLYENIHGCYRGFNLSSNNLLEIAKKIRDLNDEVSKSLS
jgi:glycosyltransferase involved in cell wall biosynthesis